MKEARFYKKEEDIVRCKLCPHLCRIPAGSTGLCRTRKNIGGALYSLVYGKAASIQKDPIEKKPLYHFRPGSYALSFGTVGCNMMCSNCQNWQTSQADPEEVTIPDFSPEEIVKSAVDSGCKNIAYTYNEPTVFYEYMLDTARIARKKGLGNVLVSNGFISQEPLIELCKYIDAANIDLKAFNDRFYRDVCGSRLNPVLESLQTLNDNGVWLETTNLLIPGLNDDLKEIGAMCSWLRENVGNVVLHFSRFFPQYRMQGTQPTQPETLVKARELAKRHLDFVYLGNIEINDSSSTACPACGEITIKREGYRTKIEHGPGLCVCGEKIPGVWE